MGATPGSTWQVLEKHKPPRLLPQSPDEALQFLVRFMPMARRTVQADGLTIFNIRY